MTKDILKLSRGKTERSLILQNLRVISRDFYHCFSPIDKFATLLKLESMVTSMGKVPKKVT